MKSFFFFKLYLKLRQNINSFFWFSKEQKKTTGQTEGFDLKQGWIFFQGGVPFLSCVHVWILNGKSGQLLRCSGILHTSSVPTLQVLRDDL